MRPNSRLRQEKKLIKLRIETITDRDTWNTALQKLPYAHILQSWEWGEFKHQTTGWRPYRWAFWRGEEIVAMASVGARQVGPLQVMYAPKGPTLRYEDPTLAAEVIGMLEARARRQFAIWLKIDPDLVLATGLPGSEDDTPYLPGEAMKQLLQRRGWRFSADQVQFRNSLIIDLQPDEDSILAAMSQNTRRKVRTADKKGVTVRPGSIADLPILYELYAATGQRDDFLIRPFDYYQTAWRSFMEAGLAHAFIAEYEGQPIAHLILFHFGRKCWYFYGASSDLERERMPNYALQWAAIRWAKAQGYALYDMWGAPDHFNESDRMWGVYEFKRGFRGSVTRHIGAWDYAPYPLLYRTYAEAWPRLRARLRS